MAKIIVTGGAGYIGSVLVPALLASGNEVTVIDNFLYHQNSLAACCGDPAFSVVNGDVRDEILMRQILPRGDIVIPLAAVVGAPACERDPVAATTINRDAIESMLKVLRPDQWLLMPVTNSGYGIGEPDALCTEESPLRPISRYGVDKVAAERAVLERENVISFRLATVFGMSPRMRIDLLVNDFVYRAVTDNSIVLFEGHFKRNYLHVKDVARVFIHGIANFATMRGRPYNVGLSDANLSKVELCRRIQERLPEFVFTEAAIGQDIDRRNYTVSNARVESTGFRPLYSIDEGISELLKGYRMIRRSQYVNF